MLVSAALVPHTALLVPGAAGAAEVLAAIRAAALEAMGELCREAPDVVVVVASHAAGPPEHHTGPMRPSLTGAGIADEWLGWRPPATGETAPVGVSVALLVLRAGGWTGPVASVTVGIDDAPDLRDVGARLASDAPRVALLLAGTLSARRGPTAPLPADVRAPTVDDAVLADLADLGPHAVARLAAVPAELARDLAISAWGPWQVLLGAAGDRTPSSCTVHNGGPLDGVRYAVLSWRWP